MLVYIEKDVSFKVRANDNNRTMRMFCCQASANMVIVMALFNVSQYTKMVSLTPDYVYMMIEPVFNSIHYLQMMIINSIDSLAQYIAQFEFAMPKMKKGKRRRFKQSKTKQHTTPIKSQSSNPLLDAVH